MCVSKYFETKSIDLQIGKLMKPSSKVLISDILNVTF